MGGIYPCSNLPKKPCSVKDLPIVIVEEWLKGVEDIEGCMIVLQKYAMQFQICLLFDPLKPSKTILISLVSHHLFKPKSQTHETIYTIIPHRS